MQKRNAIAVATSVALVSVFGATTMGTSLADRGAGDEPPAVSRIALDDEPVASDDDSADGHGRGRGRGGDDD